MGEDEDGLVEGRIITPPALPGIVSPRPTLRGAELAAAHDLGADVGVCLREDLAVQVDLPALAPVGLAPGLQHEHPLVEVLSALAERILPALVGAGDVAVGRNRDVHSHLAHVCVDASSDRNSSVMA